MLTAESTGRRVYLGNLSKETRSNDIDDLCSKFGSIEDIKLKIGYGFIEFGSPAAANDCVASLDDTEFHGGR